MAVAFSGGVDSGLLAWVAHRVLGDGMVCVIGISSSLAAREEGAAIAFLEKHGIPWRRLETHEMNVEKYRANRGDRCFYCKDELFERMAAATREGFGCIAYGANTDDARDYRPGARAAESRGVVAPLAEAGLSKKHVRAIAKALGLEMWNKPAAPCLASRIPYFREVTPEKLRQVEAAEDVLHGLGFDDCRVRHHGSEARVEVPDRDRERLSRTNIWRIVVNGFRAAGFEDVVLEQDGLRSGRLNDALGGA